MFRKCVVLAVLGCALATPVAQYQVQEEGIPPHLLRQYIGQGQQHAQRPQHIPQAAPAPARLPYNVPSEEQYQPRQQYQAQPQYQPQPQYQAQPQPQPQPQPQYRPQAQREERPEDFDANPSYQFGFDVNDDQFTNYQNRKEQRDGDVIKGSYSVVDSDGFIRTVTYTADPKEGFKAEVSRKPTDIVVKIPTPKPQFQEQHVAQHVAQPQPQVQQAAQPRPNPHQQQYYRYE
ncbi:activating signal cointegrator 1 complex subunit 2 homolog isoform X2 [Colias croceus]|uniref:activating signal cointegrator 1 complex subunit 2 homolog isoform X2 n=1 Tax=Colias crocea TaxID=72248 RepID=UPI001E27E51A|nr:activating signal cointegrator 1 complex subunit 2 homolog isoform X2 [Colias croceus]